MLNKIIGLFLITPLVIFIYLAISVIYFDKLIPRLIKLNPYLVGGCVSLATYIGFYFLLK